MSKWDMVKLGDVCHVNPPKKQILSMLEGKEVSFVPMASVDGNGNIDVRDIRTYSEVSNGFSYFKENDVLFAKITPCMENGKGAIAKGLVNGVGVGSTEFHILRADEKYMISEWIYRYLSYSKIRKAAEKSMTGSAGQKRVPKTFLENLLIPLPPLDVQKHIADTLDKTQEIINCHKKQLEELDNLLKATFNDMFGDPVMNEKGWDTIELGKGAKLIGGYAFKSKDYIDEGVRLVQIANVQKDILSWEVTNYLPKEYLDKYKNYNLSSGDIVLAMTRPIIKSLDAVKIAVVQESDKPCLLNQRVGKFDINIDLINPTFLLEFCRSQYFKNAVELFSSNSLQPNVSSKQIESIICYLPPLELQNKFAEIVTKIEEQKSLVKQSIKESQTLFNSLMSKYFD